MEQQLRIVCAIDEEEERRGMISRRDVYTRAHTCPGYVSACKSIVVVTANPRAQARRCLQAREKEEDLLLDGGRNFDGILRRAGD